MFILAVYQLGIYVISRDSGYLDLFAMLSAMVVFIYAHSGWAGSEFGWGRIAVIQLFFVTTAAALHFGARFLDLKSTAPTSDRLIKWLCYSCLVAAGGLYIPVTLPFFESFMFVGIVAFFGLQVVALRLVWQGDTRAKYYLAGVSLICLASIWSIMAYLIQGFTTTTDTWILLGSMCASCLVWCVSYAHQLSDLQAKQAEDKVALMQARFNESEAIRLSEAAAAQSEAASEFLATMSHEIRTPMNGVLGMAEALEESSLNPEQQKDLSILVRSGRSLMVVLNDILDYSKYSSGNIDLDIQETEVVHLLDDATTVLQSRAAEKGLGLYVYTDANLPTEIFVDRARLVQVLSNLLSNAIKFTDEGSVILAAKFDEDHSEIEFIVRDTGIGISEVDQARLFNRFSQAESGIHRKYGGTGLGLAIVKLLVESMSGTFGIESEVGNGSNFWLRIPVLASTVKQSFPVRDIYLAAADEKLTKQAQLFYEWVGQHVTTGVNESSDLSIITEDWQKLFEPPVALSDLAYTLNKVVQTPVATLSNCSLNANLLVAEDNKVNQMVIKRLLETKFDCHVTIVEDGQAAIDSYTENRNEFDCILMDCEMPVIDGYAATMAIRQIEEAEDVPGVPIIALTAHVVEAYRNRALKAGMNGFVTKPIDQNELFSSLREAMTKSPNETKPHNTLN